MRGFPSHTRIPIFIRPNRKSWLTGWMRTWGERFWDALAKGDGDSVDKTAGKSLRKETEYGKDLPQG